jgi:phosphoglycolate phosphatase-like HAD superfamily hydrolase
MHLFFDCDGVLIKESGGETYPGISGCLKKLSQTHSLYVVSLKDEEAISLALKKAELDGFFVDIFGKDRVGEVGFYHHVFLNPMDELNIEKEEAMALGDTTGHIQAAKKAGIPIIACSWGKEDREDLIGARPDFMADTPEELLSIIEEA